MAEIAAREMPRLPLDDALDLLLLYAEKADPKFERAAAEWLSRVIEEKNLTTQEVALAANALTGLRGRASLDSARLLAAIASSM